MEYDLAGNSMAYLQAAQGYKSGGVTFDYNMIQGDPTGTTYDIVNLASHKFDEETSIAYELGGKNRFLNNTLQINGALFLTAYKGLQVMMWKRINEENEDEDPVMFIGNGGKTNTYGAEIETTWLATGDDRVNVSLSSMHGKYHDLVIKYDNPAWAGGGSNPPVDLEGIDMANMPKLTFNLGYTHTFMFAEYGALAATLDTTYKTEYYNTIEITNQGSLVPSHHISNFYLNWTSPESKFSASANIKNIENKAIATNASQRGVGLNAPRTYNASLTVKF
jgi:iron complex outermembrane receptor protein